MTTPVPPRTQQRKTRSLKLLSTFKVFLNHQSIMSYSRPKTSRLSEKRLLADVDLTPADTAVQDSVNERTTSHTEKTSRCSCSAIFICYIIISLSEGGLFLYPSFLYSTNCRQLAMPCCPYIIGLETFASFV